MLNPVSQATTDKLAIGAAVVVGLLILYTLKKAADAAAAAPAFIAENAHLVNPLSTGNAAYQAANAIADAILGTGPDSVGTRIYGAVSDELDPRMYTQAELERITAARNHYGRDVGGWIVG